MKIDEYFAIGIKQVWIVEPQRQEVLVHASPTEAVAYGAGDRIPGAHHLSGLEIEVNELLR